MLRKYIRYAAGFVVLTISLFSCELITGPNFPDTPRISFRDIRKFRITKLSNAIDSISIGVKFQDGNGDLGLTQEEINTNPPHNYYIKGFRKVNGEWEPEPFGFTINGHYPLLNPGKEGPIEGTLFYGPLFPILAVPQNTILKFEVYIMDRAGNVSNTIETSEITVNER